MTVQHVFAGIGVSDYARAMTFYEQLFGRSPDVIVNDHESMWQLRSGSWVYVVLDPERAGTALLTVMVDDLDEFLIALGSRGVAAGPIGSPGPDTRSAFVRDPDGTPIQIAEHRAG
jgi:catechol 2,3-dioxygenase-like lactoylglutathione lyase family enzyme